jgi:hypothetical protein
VGAYLPNWDAVQYALGLVEFDVVQHQPHPPGSILYVALGRLALLFVGEANRALAGVSVAASAVSTALVYAVGRQMFGARIAWVATALFFAAPLTWYYGVVALPYALEGALGLAAAGLCWKAAEEKSAKSALAAAAVLAAAGGVRQTSLVLLLPLWLYAAWRAGRPDLPARGTNSLSPWKRVGVRGAAKVETRGSPHPFGMLRAGSSPLPAGGGTGVAGVLWREVRLPLVGLCLIGLLCLAWAVPLLVSTGGVGPYLRASRQLSTLVGSMSSIFVGGLPAAAANATYVLDVVLAALNAAAAAFAVYLIPGERWPWRPSPQQRALLTLWAAPALVVYCAMHIGQAGYLLLVLPLGCYAAATALLSAADLIRRRCPAARRHASPAVVGLAVACSAAVFLFSPLLGAAANGLAASSIREADLRWGGVVTTVRRYSPERTVVLTGSTATESFRHAGYYLPEYHVYAVGFDRHGTLGIVFEAAHGRHTYARFMAGGSAELHKLLPPGTERLIILDAAIAGAFPNAALEPVRLAPASGRDRGGRPLLWILSADSEGGTLSSISFPRPIRVD